LAASQKRANRKIPAPVKTGKTAGFFFFQQSRSQSQKAKEKMLYLGWEEYIYEDESNMDLHAERLSALYWERCRYYEFGRPADHPGQDFTDRLVQLLCGLLRSNELTTLWLGDLGLKVGHIRALCQAVAESPALKSTDFNAPLRQLSSYAEKEEAVALIYGMLAASEVTRCDVPHWMPGLSREANGMLSRIHRYCELRADLEPMYDDQQQLEAVFAQ
jgi:hypothetical protein